MYCMNCGVKLGDTEKRCPLCGVTAFHPELSREDVPPLYPAREPVEQVNSRVAQIVITTLLLISGCISVLCDLQLNSRVVWSGYVIGGLLIFYISLVLPYWFRRPNPVVFVAAAFVAVGVYLLYINQSVDGDWFLSFAFPVTGVVGILVTAVVTLMKYVPKGGLYIIGGALIALGIFMPVMELLLCITFAGLRFLGWSFYPLIVLVLLGGMLVFLAICRPAREKMERKFFF